MPGRPPVLVFGYGNPSRGDDALGPELLARLTTRVDPRAVELLTDFQLQVEHALDLEGRALVLFVDASVSCPAPFAFTRLTAARDASYTSHAVSPGAVLHAFEHTLGGTPPPAFLLTLRGDAFELGAPLGAPAQGHLRGAIRFVQCLLSAPEAAAWERLAA